MSKRYGRQQKKKARSEIERLKGVVGTLEVRSKRFRESTASTVNAARDIIEAVRDHCPNSVFLERGRIEKGHYQSTPYSCVLNPFVVAEPSVDWETPIDMRRIDLYDLELSIREAPFQNAVHFQLDIESPHHGENQRACYRLSMEGFRVTPTHHIVNELVRLLKETT